MAKKRILLIDDESGFTTILRLNLSSTYDVCAENNPLRALETARKFKPDMIFLDVIMPECDGGTVAAQMKEDPSLRDVPIVFLTAIVSPQEATSTAGIGGYEFLAKPVGKDQIIESIKKHLGA